MIKKYRANKKGNWFVENLGQIVLTSIGIGIGIYFLWAYVLHGGGDSVKSLQQCGSITGNKGECKEACDKSLELELPNVGCSGVTSKCCVLKDDNMNDVILPTGYGRSEKYEFSVSNIGVDKTVTLPSVCKADNRQSSSIRCIAGSGFSLPITVGASNTGSEAITVRADPVVVVMDNGDTIREHKYKGTLTNIPVKDSASLATTIVITPTDAKPNSYWEIYPYAICETQECKKADTSSRGIYRKESTNSNVLTIKFVNEI